MRMTKKQKTSNMVLAVLGAFIMTFIISMEVIFCIKGSVPDTLIQYTLGAGGLELFVLAAIKVSKVWVGEPINLEREEVIYEQPDSEAVG